MRSNWLRSKIHQHCTSNCDLCGLTIRNQNSKSIWCDSCLSYFSPEPRCRCCGLPTLTPVSKCGHCLTEPPAWNRLYCIGDYQPPLSDYVFQIKYKQNYQLAYDLTYLLASQIDEAAPLILPVPLHWKRYLRRGYNQSSLLARYLQQHLPNKPEINENLLSRTKSTPPQQDLSFEERQRNLRGAFTIRGEIKHKHVAIIDDVVTTGSTVRHLCNLLLDIEVERIDIYCLCRTPQPS